MDGVDGRDAEAEAYDSAGARAAAGADGNPVVFRPLDEIPYDEEVAREAHLFDDGEFIYEAFDVGVIFVEAHAGKALLAAYIFNGSHTGVMESATARRRYEEASTRALQLDPGNVTAARARNWMLLMDGSRDEAVTSAGQLVSRHPNNAAARFSLAEALVHAGEIDEARSTVEFALRMDPKPDPHDLGTLSDNVPRITIPAG